MPNQRASAVRTTLPGLRVMAGLVATGGLSASTLANSSAMVPLASKGGGDELELEPHGLA